jgi:diguanylate cyclase (GGDEF)-like protein
VTEDKRVQLDSGAQSQDDAVYNTPILVVDDVRDNLDLMEALLIGEGYPNVLLASSGAESLRILENRADIGLVLLDLMMPDMDGYSVCRRIVYSDPWRDIPVIMVTGGAVLQREAIEKSFAAGAMDFITKPINEIELFARIRAALTLYRERVSRQEAERRYRHLATHDPLTNLPNRSLFDESVKRALARAVRADERLAVLFLDLDRFKAINDTFGHACGDLLLQDVAGRLQGCVREADIIARQGGDEFTLLLESIDNPGVAVQIARRVNDVLAKPFLLEGHEVFVSTSIGASFFPEDGDDVQSLLKNADAAMYRAKAVGGDTYQFYTADMNARALERLMLESSLRRAVDKQEFLLHYQPRVDLKEGRVVGMEALIRWQDPARGLIPPGDFISLAEETGVISQLGEWALREACRQSAVWQPRNGSSFRIAVNVSARQFRRDDLARVVAQVVADTGAEPGNIDLEITENVIMEDVEKAIEVLNELSGMGIRIPIDDFGTGYSSLSYLRRLPLNALKIDKSFVNDVTTNADDAVIATAIINLAHSLHLTVVAEGVETGEQLEFLRRHGCDECQGFLFSPPLPLDEASRLLARGLRYDLEAMQGGG